MQWISEISTGGGLAPARIEQRIDGMLESMGPLRRVLLVPPDYSRRDSGAGQLTVLLFNKLKGRAHVEVMPALGTHVPMSETSLGAMFPGIPADRFRVHRWREDLTRLGEAPAAFIEEISEGRLHYPIACEINKALTEEAWDRIISIGQIVPHEVVGMANQSKNIFVGLGGGETIHKTHFLGAVYGMERMMGRSRTPVRAIFDYMAEHFTAHLPITYLMTVREVQEDGAIVTRGLFAGDDGEAFRQGCDLSVRVNIHWLDEPVKKAVVYMDPDEFHTTWIGGKGVYRTRMAIADGGELVLLAPGVRRFGEDDQIDRLIRRHGYRDTAHALRCVEKDPELAANLSAAAHLIHSCGEGRFTITYCTDPASGGLTREEVEGAGFQFCDLREAARRYDPRRLAEGFNRLPDGEDVYYVGRPALGLWATRSRFGD